MKTDTRFGSYLECNLSDIYWRNYSFILQNLQSELKHKFYIKSTLPLRLAVLEVFQMKYIPNSPFHIRSAMMFGTLFQLRATETKT
jgi:hypothetical protein